MFTYSDSDIRFNEEVAFYEPSDRFSLDQEQFNVAIAIKTEFGFDPYDYLDIKFVYTEWA